jgi:hypothetical protein
VRRALELHLPASRPSVLAIAAPCTAGGSRADVVHVPGAPPAAVRLTPCSAGVIAEALAEGVRAAGAGLSPGARRLLRAGEHAELLGARVAVVADAAPSEGGTRVAAAALLAAAASGEDPVAGPQLLVLSGPAAGRRLPLRGDQVIGRGRAADVRVKDPLASRRHARIVLAEGRATVEDLGAKNGVRLNGARIERGPAALEHGDELRVGETLLGVVLPGAAAPPRAPATARVDADVAPRRRGAAPIAAAALLAVSAAALALSSW